MTSRPSTPAHDQPHRERLRHRPSPHRADQGSTLAARLMLFKLVTAAAKTGRRLKGENQLPKVIKGVKFVDGVEVIDPPAQHAA